MADIELTCVLKSSVGGHQGVTHVGNKERLWSQMEIVALITLNSHTYFIKVEDRRSHIALWRGGGTLCLRGHAYGIWNDDLLLLPGCA